MGAKIILYRYGVIRGSEFSKLQLINEKLSSDSTFRTFRTGLVPVVLLFNKFLCAVGEIARLQPGDGLCGRTEILHHAAITQVPVPV